MTAGGFASLFVDFNQPEVVVEPPPPVEPTFSAAELDTARQEAWNEGHQAASQASADLAQREGAAIFAQLLARSRELDQALEQRCKEDAAAVARWLVGAFVAAFPDLSNGSLAGRTQLVAELLEPALKAQSKIELRNETGTAVSFDSMHDVCRQIEAQQIEDPSGGPIVIAWQQGQAQIDLAKTWEDIRSAIMPLAADKAAPNEFEIILTPGKSN